MIEVDPNFGDGVVAFRHYGTMTEREFTDLAATVSHCAPHGAVLLLLDWLGIERWAFTAPQTDTLAAWRKAARALQCAAIVHDQRLNRQAAWLGAVLREEGVIVRSWPPQRAAAATVWLRAARSLGSSDRYC
ncbi:MAG: hypothetical protein EOR81_05345 [Mesorhizobium sp.]|nr:MAG: hypothetical protein EOR81_05345 [Mesorhizobium sp.]